MLHNDCNHTNRRFPENLNYVTGQVIIGYLYEYFLKIDLSEEEEEEEGEGADEKRERVLLCHLIMHSLVCASTRIEFAILVFPDDTLTN